MDLNPKSLIIPAIAAILSFAALFAVRGIAFRFLLARAGKNNARIDDIIIEAFRGSSLYWCLAIGLSIGASVSELPAKYVFYFSRSIHVIVIFSVTVAAANLASRIFTDYIHRSGFPVPATGLAYGVLKGTILIIGFLIILSVLEISITPLLTALGVGGLAVALALQDTLANLFSGIHILVERSIRVGDVIRLESGQEGRVEDITWRTTRILMRPNNMVVIPNSKLAQSVVTNYCLPGKELSLAIPVRVGYTSDAEAVEKILIEEATNAVGKIPGLLGAPEPFVRLSPVSGEGSLDLTLFCQVRGYEDQSLVQHELKKLIIKRLKQEGIEMPYPQRTVCYREERGQ
ncbi:MAG: mechanosensitive ion channel family protein [Nitrospirae bacterium]|nr:mechanosensitive ion channel family protein [Nitrospirota bacterium]